MQTNAGTLSQFASFMGVSAPYVTKLKKQGRLVFVSVDGKELVDFAASKKSVIDSADVGREHNGLSAKRGPGRPPNSGTTPENKIELTYRQARTHEAAYRAKLTELEYRNKEGDLVKAEDVLNEWQSIVANVRARLLALPSKLAAQGFAARSRGELQKLLTEGVNEALAELAGGRRDD